MAVEEQSYDILIIGLGPSGATLARLLKKSFRVAAIDKKSKEYSSPGFHKPCGGLLATDAQKALAQFDLTLPKKILVDPQIFAVRTIDLDTGMERRYQRFYINMDRHKFDLWMENLIGSHVKRYSEAVCTKIRKTPEGFQVEIEQKGKQINLFCRYIVGADGANSFVRRTFFPEKKPREYLSIQQWFQEKNPNPFYSCIFDSENTDCYSWSISKDGYFIFGGAYPKQNGRARFENQKRKLEQKGFYFGPALKTEACLVLRPSGWQDFCMGGNGIFLIGEAAGFISPSSLEGISSAIHSATILSKILNKGGGSFYKKYYKKTFFIRFKLMLKLLKCPFLYQPWLRKWVMKSGIQKIDKIQ